MPRLIVLLLALIGAPVALAETLVEVFTDAAHPVAGAAALAAEGVQVELYDLDAPARFEAELGRDLPADPEAAMSIAQARVAALDPVLLARHLSTLTKVVMGARSLLPARWAHFHQFTSRIIFVIVLSGAFDKFLNIVVMV